MDKRITVLFAALLSLTLLAGCGRSGAAAETPAVTEAPAAEEPAGTAEPAAEPVPGTGDLGGWRLPESEELTEERRAVFASAAESLLGVDYEPLAYLGSQVVSGTNHAFFCAARATAPEAQTYYALVYVYEDLQGSVKLLGVQSMTPGGEFDENASAAAPSAGGWSAPEAQEEGLAAFDAAVEGLTGVNYTPVRVLGQQVVAGMNYCLLCRAAVVYPGAEPYWCLARVYRDLSGTCSVSEFTDLELAAP